MTLEEAQQEILRLNDVNNNLTTERDDFKSKYEVSVANLGDKDTEIERLREHNNLLWQRCSTQDITEKEQPKENKTEEKIEVKSIEEIISSIE